MNATSTFASSVSGLANDVSRHVLATAMGLVDMVQSAVD